MGWKLLRQIAGQLPTAAGYKDACGFLVGAHAGTGRCGVVWSG